MRISEVVVEGDLSNIKKLSSKNFKTGADFVDKIFTPSKWFEKSKKSKDDNLRPTTSVKPHLEKAALAHALSGTQLYPDDVQALKSLRAKVAGQKIRIDDDPNEVMIAIKAAYQSKQLTDYQKTLLTNLINNL